MVTDLAPEADAGQLLTAVEVAGLLRVAPSFVYRLSREGRIPTVKISGRYVRYSKPAIETWIRERAR